MSLGDALAILGSPAIGGFWLGSLTAAPTLFRRGRVDHVIEDFGAGAVYGTMMVTPVSVVVFIVVLVAQ